MDQVTTTEMVPGRTGPAGTPKKIDPQVRQAAEDFEAIFLGQMLAPMFQGLETDGLFGGGSAERVYRSMMIQEYGRAMAANGGIGIADAVQREILRMQETTE